MTNESYWYSLRYLWGTYAIYLAQFQTPACLIDGMQLYLLQKTFQDQQQSIVQACVILGIWILFTKIVKLLPHLSRYPQDVKCLPRAVLFSYLHGLINVYALLTLHVTSWGSQDLEELKAARAEDEEVIPMLRDAMAEAEPYREPTPGESSPPALPSCRVLTHNQGDS